MEQSVSLPMAASDRQIAAANSAASARQLLLYLVVLAGTVVFMAYLPALSARATFLDDTMYLAENPLVTNPSWASVRRFFTEVLRPSTVRGYYQPLTMVSLMVDYALSGPSGGLRSFHQTSLLLHVANTALVIILLYLLFGEAWTAAAMGLLFGLHPIAVDSVCWLSERKTVLASFFALWSLICYVLFVQQMRKRYYVACTFLYLLALLSKPITMPLPLAMVLLDYWPLDRLRRATVAAKLPLLAIAAVFGVITYISQNRTAPVFLPGEYSPLYVPLILCHNIVFYLWKFLWPLNLSPHYALPHPFGLSHPMVLAGMVGTCTLVALLLVSVRRTRALLTGWLIFFLVLSPAMGIISVTPVLAANRYAYLPSVGLFIALAGILSGVRKVGKERQIIGRAVMAIIALAAAGGEMFATTGYLHHWRDTKSLYQHALLIAPNEPILHNGLGFALSLERKEDEAITRYRQALRISPGYVLARFNLAVALSQSEETKDEAMRHYHRILELEPSNYKAHLNLGNLLLIKAKYDEAAACFARAVEVKRDYVTAHHNLGKTLIVADRPQEGIEHLRRAIDLSPSYLPALRDLAWFLATHPNPQVHDPNQAMKLAERAKAMTRGQDAGVLDTLAAGYALSGYYRKAVDTAERAIAMAKRLRNYELASDIEERLQLYQYECPYYENPRVQLERLMAKAKKKAGDPTSAAEEEKLENGGTSNPQSEYVTMEVQDEAATILAE